MCGEEKYYFKLENSMLISNPSNMRSCNQFVWAFTLAKEVAKDRNVSMRI